MAYLTHQLPGMYNDWNAPSHATLNSLALQHTAYANLLAAQQLSRGPAATSAPPPSSSPFWPTDLTPDTTTALLQTLHQNHRHHHAPHLAAHAGSNPTADLAALAALLQAQNLSSHSHSMASTSAPSQPAPFLKAPGAHLPHNAPFDPLAAFLNPSVGLPKDLNQVLLNLASSPTPPSCSSPPASIGPHSASPPAHSHLPSLRLHAASTHSSAPSSASPTSPSPLSLSHPALCAHSSLFDHNASYPHVNVASSDISDASTDTLKGVESGEDFTEEEIAAAAWERSRTLAVLGIKYDGVVSAELRRSVGAPFQHLKGFVGVYMPAMSLRSCKTNRRSRSFAFIKFTTPAAASAALGSLLAAYPDGCVPIVLPGAGGQPIRCLVERVQEKSTADLVQKYRSFVKSCQRLGLYHLLS